MTTNILCHVFLGCLSVWVGVIFSGRANIFDGQVNLILYEGGQVDACTLLAYCK